MTKMLQKVSPCHPQSYIFNTLQMIPEIHINDCSLCIPDLRMIPIELNQLHCRRNKGLSKRSLPNLLYHNRMFHNFRFDNNFMKTNTLNVL